MKAIDKAFISAAGVHAQRGGSQGALSGDYALKVTWLRSVLRLGEFMAEALA